MKKLLGVLAVMLLVTGMQMNNVEASDKEEHAGYDNVLKYAFVDSGKNRTDSDFLLKNSAAGEVSVRAFKVLEDGRAMILDARQEKILIFQDSILVSDIDISFCIDPMFFTWEDGNIIVYDCTSFGDLYYLGEDGEVLRKRELPENIIPSTIAGFYRLDGMNHLITYDKEIIELTDFHNRGYLFNVVRSEEVYSVEFEGNTWKMPCNDRQFFNPFYVDEEGCLYIEESTLAKGTKYIQGESFLLKLDTDGNEIMSMRLPLEEYSSFPDQYFDFCQGNVYVLELFDMNCQVSKVTMCAEREKSLIPEMEEQGRREVKSSVNEKSVNAISVNRTREQVASEAYSIVNAGWTINKGNKTIVSGAILPKYISEATEGTRVVGIPYCWGGYDYLSSVLGKLVGGNMAGNVNKKVVDGPVGYDCSGFVSYCYGLGIHIGTEEMLAKVTLTSVDSGSMQSMDLLWKNGHVMLFRGYSGNYINVYESTTNGSQKARAYSYTYDLIFNDKQYEAYSPW